MGQSNGTTIRTFNLVVVWFVFVFWFFFLSFFLLNHREVFSFSFLFICIVSAFVFRILHAHHSADDLTTKQLSVPIFHRAFEINWLAIFFLMNTICLFDHRYPPNASFSLSSKINWRTKMKIVCKKTDNKNIREKMSSLTAKIWERICSQAIFYKLNDRKSKLTENAFSASEIGARMGWTARRCESETTCQRWDQNTKPCHGICVNLLVCVRTMCRRPFIWNWMVKMVSTDIFPFFTWYLIRKSRFFFLCLFVHVLLMCPPLPPSSCSMCAFTCIFISRPLYIGVQSEIYNSACD